jgi:hypothetical protein
MSASDMQRPPTQNKAVAPNKLRSSLEYTIDMVDPLLVKNFLTKLFFLQVRA